MTVVSEILIDIIYLFQYKVDCLTRSLSSYPNVTFIIGGQTFTLTPLQYILILNSEPNRYVCYTIFAPSNIYDSQGHLFWIFGNFFLYRFYAIFDFVNRRIGLATSISYNWTQPIDQNLFNNSLMTNTASMSNRIDTILKYIIHNTILLVGHNLIFLLGNK